MFELTINYGMRSALRHYPQAPTVGEVKQDTSLKAELGFGDNVRVLVGGAAQADHITIPVHSITIETAANQKAA